MAIIKLIKQADVLTGKATEIHTRQTVGEWLIANYKGSGIQYAVFNSDNLDITTEFELLCETHEEVKVIELPSATLGVAGIVAIVSLVISVAAVVLMPKPKGPPQNVNRNQESPNNELGRPSNRARPFERIPDIKGKVKSTPDIIMPIYTMFENGVEVEHGYYCVGRKKISLADINDSDTPISLITGASAGVYYPGNNPNLGAPDVQVGDAIDRDIYTNYRLNDVNGIYLPPEQSVGATPIVFDDSYDILVSSGGSLGDQYAAVGFQLFGTHTTGKWTFVLLVGVLGSAYEIGSPDYYEGNSIILENFIIRKTPAGTPYDLSGTYNILEYVPDNDQNFGLFLELPSDFGVDKVPQAWYPDAGASVRTLVSTPYNDWYYFTRDAIDRGFITVIAQNGIYRDTGGASLLPLTVDFEFDIEGIDKTGAADGSVLTYSGSISGNNQALKGVTVEFTPTYQSRFRIRVRRTTPRNTSSGTIVDSIKLKDVYALKDLGSIDFGDVTTIQTRTIANQSATSIKERQLNCQATEMLYVYEGAGVFAGTLTTNTSAIQSYITDFIDPVMGGRPIAELDADGLLDLETEINSYFGNTKNSRFYYTLDSTEITFQEYTFMLFDAINCIAYRDGSIVRAHFEKEDATPTMLFTHRSKIPDTEVYSRNFNLNQMPDGVDFKYRDPSTNEMRLIKVPADGSAVRPKSFEIPGILNFNQAYKRAWREYNKIKYGREVVTFEATAEARYLKPGAVFSVVRGNRSNTTDGDVLSVDGSVLTLSQDVSFTSGDTHSIVLKLSDGTTESIICTAGPTTNSVTLTDTPSEALRTEMIYQRRTEFSFGNEDKLNAQLFIAREIDMANKYTVKITGVNYTGDYYTKDVQSLRAFSAGFSSGFN